MADQPQKPFDPIPSDLVSQDASFADLVETFVDGLGKRMTEMEAALGEGDYQSLKRCAHQLKGSGGGYGYPVLTTLSADLERQALSEDLPACQAALNELKELISRVVVKLD